jgi:two-component system, cell cycle sensor histidine kinase and response regulator CckA
MKQTRFITKRSLSFLIIVFTGVCVLVFNLIYEKAKESAVNRLNDEQMIHARQAARGIEEHFATWTGILTSLSRMGEIVNLDEAGKRQMELFYDAHHEQIRSFTRMDENGTILFTIPDKGMIGRNLKSQKHVQELLKTRKPVVSNVFRTLQGFDAVALHVPVFKGAQFKGSIAVTINFQTLAKRYLEIIKIGKTGYAWVVSRDGTELYCPVPGHIGHSVFANCKDFPSIISMATDMLKGHSGVTTYTFDKISGTKVTPVEKHAVYFPIKLGNTFWSIVVASSEQEILSSLSSYRNRLLLVMVMVLIGGSIIAWLGVKALLIVKEENIRMLAEDALRESEDRFRHVSSVISDIAYSCGVDENGRYAINWMTGAAERICGYSIEEIKAHKCWQFLVLEEDLVLFAENVAGLAPGSHGSCELRIRHKNGSMVWLASHAECVTGLEAQGRQILYGGLVDITARKRAENALRESEVRYRELVENANSIILRMDKIGTVTFINEFAQQFFGYHGDEIVGRSVIGTIVPESDSSGRDLRDMILDIGLHPERYVANENENMKRDGTKVWISWTNKPMTNSSGMVHEILCVGIDATARKFAEEEKEKLLVQLNQAQRMESVGRLAGGVAHDFNNMLGVILGHAEMALLKSDPVQPLYSDLQAISKAAQRSANLTRQLLAFARKQTIAPKVLDLDETVEGMLKILERLIGEDIDLGWMPGKDLWQVKVDTSQLDQILANLCINARDAIAGVGKITIETANASFDEKYCSHHVGFVPGEFVMLAVSDDGCGMDKETVSKIFDPFFTTKGIGEGTGLGLATVYGIVKQNNGIINVYSEPGQGTSIKIYLPRYAAKAPLREIKDAREVVGGHEMILLVEDEPDILNIAREMLESFGYSVLAAGTPGEAIHLAEEHTGEINLLITDVIMPEMNGRELAKRLLSLYPDMICMFMSGYTDDVIAHRGLLEEGVHFIQKPFSSQGLSAKVREALDVM